jgi:hypothetical protein
LSHEIQAVTNFLHLKLSQALHKNPIYLGFMDVQSFGCGTVLELSTKYLQKVVNFLIVDLQEGTKKLVSVLETFILFENSIDGSWDDTGKVRISLDFAKISHLFFIGEIFIDKILPVTSKHCVGLTRASLTVGKDGEVGAVEYLLGVRLKMCENLELGLTFGDDLVKFALNVVDLVVVYFEGPVL